MKYLVLMLALGCSATQTDLKDPQGTTCAAAALALAALECPNIDGWAERCEAEQAFERPLGRSLNLTCIARSRTCVEANAC